MPKIDIVGSESESETNQFNYEGININGQGIPVLGIGGKNYVIQFRMPIFKVNAISSRKKLTHNMKELMKILYLRRENYSGCESGYSNVVILVANIAPKQAVISATSALEATKVGYKVGTRNVVDLLQAEKNLYSAEKNLANAKYDYILANLRLDLCGNYYPWRSCYNK